MYVPAEAPASPPRCATTCFMSPQWGGEQNRTQLCHEHPAPHAAIIAPNKRSSRRICKKIDTMSRNAIGAIAFVGDSGYDAETTWKGLGEGLHRAVACKPKKRFCTPLS